MNIDHKELASKRRIEQPDALRLAERISDFLCTSEEDAKVIAAAADELVRLHSENETLQAGYAAARLRIESLQARIKAMAEEHEDELMVAHMDGRSQAAQQPAPSAAATQDMIAAVLQLVDLEQGDVEDHRYDDGSKLAEQICKAVLALVPQPSHTPRAGMRAAQPAGAQAAPELTETAVTARNPAAPASSFDDSRTQAVYEVLVNDNYPPAGSNEHWEGWKARLIVDALFPIEAPAAVAGQDVMAWMTQDGDRVVTARTMDAARRDGGAMLSSLRGYSVALMRANVDAAAPTTQADSVLEDAARLDWLLLRISGAEFRRIGVHYSGNASRADVDTARKQGANHD